MPPQTTGTVAVAPTVAPVKPITAPLDPPAVQPAIAPQPAAPPAAVTIRRGPDAAEERVTVSREPSRPEQSKPSNPGQRPIASSARPTAARPQSRARRERGRRGGHGGGAGRRRRAGRAARIAADARRRGVARLLVPARNSELFARQRGALHHHRASRLHFPATVLFASAFAA